MCNGGHRRHIAFLTGWCLSQTETLPADASPDAAEKTGIWVETEDGTRRFVDLDRITSYEAL